MATIEIALSADRESDLRKLEKKFWSGDIPVLIRHEEPIDLLLREHVSWFDRRKAPDFIITSHRDFYTDLKVIADLKKVPSFQWVRVLVIVDQDTTRIRNKFLEFGITEVLEWKIGAAALEEKVNEFISRYAATRRAG